VKAAGGNGYGYSRKAGLNPGLSHTLENLALALTE
jgi:hypothetical protein